MAGVKDSTSTPEDDRVGTMLGPIMWVHCNSCGRETRHEPLWVKTREFPEYDEGEVCNVELLRSRVLTCLGCMTLTFEQSWSAWGHVDRDGNDIWDPTYYPPRMVGRRKLKMFANLSISLERMYKEVVEAFNSGQRLLCAIGLRALIEGICADLGVVPTNKRHPKIWEKIEGLKKKLPEGLVNNLHSFRFMGNWVAHELATPEQQDLDLAIDVMEDLMNFLYHLDYKASRLHRRRGWNKESTEKAQPGSPGESEAE